MFSKKAPIYYITILLFFLFVIANLRYVQAQQSADQAYAWLHGKLNLIGNVTINDTITVNNKTYWTLGPFPSVILVPFVVLTRAVNLNYAQNVLNILLIPFIFFLVYRLAKFKGFSSSDSHYLALAFCAGSVFFQVALYPTGWMVSQSVSVVLVLLAITEYFYKNRSLLIGFLLAFVLATRPTAFLAVVFFGLAILSSKEHFREKAKRLVMLSVPILVIGILLLFYNYVRFGNVFMLGYQELADAKYFPLLEKYYNQSFEHSLFSPSYIARNLSVYFLIPLKAGLWGVDISALLVCFPFIFSVKTNLTKHTVKLALSATAGILFVLLSYYWAGWDQIGPRYLTDLLPFLYLVLLYSFKEQKLSQFFKTATLVTICNNLVIFLFIYSRTI